MELYNRDGLILYFESYPKSKVREIKLVDILTNIVGNEPNYDNLNGFIAYKYFLASVDEKEHMWYKDVMYNNEKYRCVNFDNIDNN